MRHRALILVSLTLLLSCKKSRHPDGAIDCDTEIKYDARKVSARVDANKFGGVSADTSIEAVRQVDEVVERYMSRWKTMCREYNAGVMEKEEYRAEARKLRERMEALDDLIIKLEHAPDAESYQAAMREMYRTMVPETESKDLELSFNVMAQVPGAAGFSLMTDGAELPTGTNLFFSFRPSRDAHVYVYQEDAKGEISVLFPHPQIPVANPIPGGQELRIPPSQTFTVNSKDLGTEKVHITASVAPIGDLQPLLRQPDVTAAQLACGSRGLELSNQCEGTRGLELGGASSDASIRAATAAGDDRIVQTFTFQHPR